MDIRPEEICPLVWFLVTTASSLWDAEYVNGWSPHVWFPLWSMEEGEVCWCFACDTVCDLLLIQGTLNQHGYHSIMQRYAIPSGLHLVGLSFVFHGELFQMTLPPQSHNLNPGNIPGEAGWENAKIELNPIEMVWDDFLPQSEGKAAYKCSAYVGTPSRQ